MLFLDLALLIGLIGSVAAGSLLADDYVDDYVEMPNGMLFHRSCVHVHSSTFSVEDLGDGNERSASSGKSVVRGRCAYPNKRPVVVPKPTVPTVGYYSDWVAYAQAIEKDVSTPYVFMNSSWFVPPAPKSKGPLGLSSIYLFNGLEDGGGHHNASLILQPVLSFGKSGCVLDPLHWGQWNLLSFLVSGSGRAHCGPRIGVKEGEEVVGTMENTGNNTWKVTSMRSLTKETSQYVGQLGPNVHIDAAYVTLEAMILYTCASFPGGNGTTRFYNNKLLVSRDDQTSVVEPIPWTPIIKHNECHQNVQIDSDSGDVPLLY